MKANNHTAENLKAAIEKAEHYVLVASSSAVVFCVLSFARIRIGDVVKWQLLGFPMDFSPPLALVVLYLLYIFSCILADNMLLHIRDLIERLGDKDQASDILGYPSILTVSPLAIYLATIMPGPLVMIGIWNLATQGIYTLHYSIWYFAGGFGGVLSLVIYFKVHKIIKPHVEWWK